MGHQNSGYIRVRALELLGKHLGAFAHNEAEVAYSSSFFADI